MQITFDNTSLTTAPYAVEKIGHEHAPPRDIQLFTLARERGGMIVQTDYEPKTITLNGRVTGANSDDLEQNIDALKKLLSGENKNLDIAYAGGTRRYKATKTEYRENREHWQLNFVKFTVVFIVPEGVGQDVAQTNIGENAVTVAAKTGTWNFGGNAYPELTVALAFGAAVDVSKIELTISGEKITLEQAIVATDVVIFDTKNKKVTVNGVEKDYIGKFPRVAVGDNAYDIGVTSTSHSYDYDVDYYPLYL